MREKPAPGQGWKFDGTFPAVRNGSVALTLPSWLVVRRRKSPVACAYAPSVRLWQLLPQFAWSQPSAAASVGEPGRVNGCIGGFVRRPSRSSAAMFKPEDPGADRPIASKPNAP